MALKHVAGENHGHIVVYALSTCPWCHKAKHLLSELGAEYYYEDVDLLGEEEQRNVMVDVARWNPGRSFPTIVINDKSAIIGFDETALRKLMTP